jgi:2-methylisocitrate lyase-like PEP mutase family enzyme
MSQNDKAKQFAALHVKGSPVLLYNVWDAGSAKAVVEAGAKAVATSSWSVAEAQGFRDGESISVGLVYQVAGRIAASIDVPVTVDFEGGYSDDDKKLAANIIALLELGVIGINFEDRIVRGEGLYSIERQAKRIAAIRAVADEKGIELFINARTDLFLGQKGKPEDSIDEALKRAKAYSDAGASGLFIPGLTEAALIKQIVLGTELPVNVMVMGGVPNNDKLKDSGVARISYGPIPYINAMNNLKEEAKKVFS